MPLICKECGSEVASLAQDLCSNCAPYLHGGAQGRSGRTMMPVDREAVAEALLAELKRQFKINIDWVDDEFGLDDVTVDGKVDLLALADAAVRALGVEQEE